MNGIRFLSNPIDLVNANPCMDDDELDALINETVEGLDSLPQLFAQLDALLSDTGQDGAAELLLNIGLTINTLLGQPVYVDRY